MAKYNLLLVAFGIVTSLAFVEYKSPRITEGLLKTYGNTSILEISSKTKKYMDISEAMAIHEPKKITVDIPKPIVLVTSHSSAFEKTVVVLPTDFFMKSVKATVKGTSTLHDWESDVTIIEGQGSFQLKDNMLASIKDAEIKIPVKGIISKEGKKMDAKTYETFKSDKYPYIKYSFNNAEVKMNKSRVVSMETIGKLSMAGVSKSVPISAHGKLLPNGDLQLKVSKTIKMTDFSMEPPVMFLGTIKVGDEITVIFDFVLSKVNN